MRSFVLRAFAFGQLATCTVGLAITHGQNSVQSLNVAGAKGMATDLDITEVGYGSVVSLHDDAAMSIFVKRLLAAEDKFVPQDQEGELAGFVPWFSGSKATQSFKQLRDQLSSKSWVKDLTSVDGSRLTEADFQAVAALHNDTAMKLFVHALLQGESSFIPTDQESELAGFVRWFSGTNATQGFQQMRQELSNKTWVKDLKTIDGARLSEADYQAVAALRNDTAMKLFVHALLRGESKFIPQEAEEELEGFVLWFSGAKAIQSLEAMRTELSGKTWVQQPNSVGVARKAPIANAGNSSYEGTNATATTTGHKIKAMAGNLVTAFRQLARFLH